jgi:hypothetical protein
VIIKPKIVPVAPVLQQFIWSPALSAVCATMNWMGTPPPELFASGISPDRGGTCSFHELTLSSFGDFSERVMGRRVWDPAVGHFKEDLWVSRQGSSLLAFYPRGIYHVVNPLYANTHYT